MRCFFQDVGRLSVSAMSLVSHSVTGSHAHLSLLLVSLVSLGLKKLDAVPTGMWVAVGDVRA